MPTRRILELVIVGSVLTMSAAGTVKLWARKTLASQQPGSVMHGVAEIIVVVL